jgi:hypothetical protein
MDTRQKVTSHLFKVLKNRRVEIEPLVDIYMLRLEYPELKLTELHELSGVALGTFYRRIKLLKEFQLINDDNSISQRESFTRNFPLPLIIQEGTLLSSGPSYAGLASHLARYKPNETPVGFSHTKGEIVSRFFDCMATENYGYEQVVAVQNGLAFLAIAAGELEAFDEMTGRTPVMSESDFPHIFK